VKITVTPKQGTVVKSVDPSEEWGEISTYSICATEMINDILRALELAKEWETAEAENEKPMHRIG